MGGMEFMGSMESMEAMESKEAMEPMDSTVVFRGEDLPWPIAMAMDFFQNRAPKLCFHQIGLSKLFFRIGFPNRLHQCNPTSPWNP